MTPVTNSCGCPYTAYTIGDYTPAGSRYGGGGPWCPSCGARLPDRVQHPPGTMAAAFDDLNRAAAEFRDSVKARLVPMDAWVWRHPGWTGALLLVWTVLVVWSIIATS